MKVIEFAIIDLLAFFSGGYRIDEQYRLPYKKNWYMVTLRKWKRLFLFKSIDNRHEFVLIGVVLQCLAYIMFFINIILSVSLTDEDMIEKWVLCNYWIIGFVVFLILLNYLLYVYYKKQYHIKQR